MPKFVLLDAFGTLLKIPRGRHPYRQILKEGVRQGRKSKPDDLRQILTRNLNLTQATEAFGIKIRPQQMADIQGDLQADLNSIEPFEDGLRAVERLRSEGLRVAIASNLAAPYGPPVRQLYPEMDGYGFSFALGAMKPDPFFYRASCELIGANTSAYFGDETVVMIGDSEKCDRDGPRAVGIRGFLLNRQAGQRFGDLDAFCDAVMQS